MQRPSDCLSLHHYRMSRALYRAKFFCEEHLVLNKINKHVSSEIKTHINVISNSCCFRTIQRTHMHTKETENTKRLFLFRVHCFVLCPTNPNYMAIVRVLSRLRRLMCQKQ